MKAEYTAIDMSTAAADGFRDGQRAALDHSAQSLGMVGALVTALDGLLSITQDSAGVAGYHLNGNVAEWDEFPEVDTARDVLRLCREQPSAAQSAPSTGIYSSDPLACSGCAKGCFRCMSKPQSAPAGEREESGK